MQNPLTDLSLTGIGPSFIEGMEEQREERSLPTVNPNPLPHGQRERRPSLFSVVPYNVPTGKVPREVEPPSRLTTSTGDANGRQSRRNNNDSSVGSSESSEFFTQDPQTGMMDMAGYFQNDTMPLPNTVFDGTRDMSRRPHSAPNTVVKGAPPNGFGPNNEDVNADLRRAHELAEELDRLQQRELERQKEMELVRQRDREREQWEREKREHEMEKQRREKEKTLWLVDDVGRSASATGDRVKGGKPGQGGGDEGEEPHPRCREQWQKIQDQLDDLYHAREDTVLKMSSMNEKIDESQKECVAVCQLHQNEILQLCVDKIENLREFWEREWKSTEVRRQLILEQELGKERERFRAEAQATVQAEADRILIALQKELTDLKAKSLLHDDAIDALSLTQGSGGGPKKALKKGKSKDSEDLEDGSSDGKTTDAMVVDMNATGTNNATNAAVAAEVRRERRLARMWAKDRKRLCCGICCLSVLLVFAIFVALVVPAYIFFGQKLLTTKGVLDVGTSARRVDVSSSGGSTALTINQFSTDRFGFEVLQVLNQTVFYGDVWLGTPPSSLYSTTPESTTIITDHRRLPSHPESSSAQGHKAPRAMIPQSVDEAKKPSDRKREHTMQTDNTTTDSTIIPLPFDKRDNPILWVGKETVFGPVNVTFDDGSTIDVYGQPNFFTGLTLPVSTSSSLSWDPATNASWHVNANASNCLTANTLQRSVLNISFGGDGVSRTPAIQIANNQKRCSTSMPTPTAAYDVLINGNLKASRGLSIGQAPNRTVTTSPTSSAVLASVRNASYAFGVTDTGVTVTHDLVVLGRIFYDSNSSGWGLAGDSFVNGALDVAGPAVLRDGLTVAGDTHLADAEAESLTVSQLLNVTGNAVFEGAVQATNAPTHLSELYVDTITAASSVSVNDTLLANKLTVLAAADMTGPVRISDQLDVSGNVSVGGLLNAMGAEGIAAVGPIHTTNNLAVDGNADVEGDSTVHGTATIKSATPTLVLTRESSPATGTNQGQFQMQYNVSGDRLEIEWTNQTGSWPFVTASRPDLRLSVGPVSPLVTLGSNTSGASVVVASNFAVNKATELRGDYTELTKGLLRSGTGASLRLDTKTANDPILIGETARTLRLLPNGGEVIVSGVLTLSTSTVSAPLQQPFTFSRGFVSSGDGASTVFEGQSSISSLGSGSGGNMAVRAGSSAHGSGGSLFLDGGDGATNDGDVWVGSQSRYVILGGTNSASKVAVSSATLQLGNATAPQDFTLGMPATSVNGFTLNIHGQDAVTQRLLRGGDVSISAGRGSQTGGSVYVDAGNFSATDGTGVFLGTHSGTVSIGSAASTVSLGGNVQISGKIQFPGNAPALALYTFSGEVTGAITNITHSIPGLPDRVVSFTAHYIRTDLFSGERSILVDTRLTKFQITAVSIIVTRFEDVEFGFSMSVVVTVWARQP